MDKIKEILDLKQKIADLKEKRTRLETKVVTLQEEKQKLLLQLSQYNLNEDNLSNYLQQMDNKLLLLKQKLSKMESLLNKVL